MTEGTFQHQVDKAQRALDEGDLTEAKSLFQVVVELNPKSPAGPKGLLTIAEQEQDWPTVVDQAHQAKASFPAHSWWRSSLGKALVAQERIDEAIDFFRSSIDELPESPAGYSGLIPLMARTEQWQEVTKLCETGRANFPQHQWWRSWGISSMERSGDRAAARSFAKSVLEIDHTSHRALMAVSRMAASDTEWEESLLYARRGLESHPDEPWFMRSAVDSLLALDRADEARALVANSALPPSKKDVLIAHLELVEGNTDQALDLWDEIAAEDPTLDVRLSRAEAYAEALQLDDASRQFEQLLSEEPKSQRAWLGFARTAAHRKHLAEAVTRWSAALDHLPEDTLIRNGYFYALLVSSRFDEAEQILDTWREQAEPAGEESVTLLEADYYRAAMQFHQAIEIYDHLVGTTADTRVRNTAIRARADLMLRVQEGRGNLEEALSSLDGASTQSVSALTVQAKLQIALEEHAAAEESIRQLVASNTRSADRFWLEAWAETHRGNTASAKAAGRTAASRQFIPHIHAAIDELTMLRSPKPIRRGEVILYSACRDELLRIEDFLRYHREMGIEHFVIVDNGSVDGTRELLLEQPDVTTYLTHDDYVTSGSSMRWINELISQLSNQNWCVYADVDELLVYPGCETTDIGEFVAYLDSQGFDAVPGFMLDMHADTLDGGYSYAAGTPMIETCPFFTNTYDFQPFFMSPYTDVRGGFRPTVLGIDHLQMTKTPLVRSDSEVQFLLSSHETTPSVISDVSCALLHFKYIGDSVERATKEAEWTPSSYYGNNTRIYQERMMAGHTSTTDNPNRERFENSQQLVELGLIRDSESWSKRRDGEQLRR